MNIFRRTKRYTSRTAAKCLHHPLEVCSHICDGVTIIGVVVLQDIYLVEATVMCLAASIICFVFNYLGYRRGTRKVFPKVLDVVVPLMFAALLPATILHTDLVHRYVFLSINSCLALTALGSALFRRPFTWEYLAEMFPRHTWYHPVLRRGGYVSCLAWGAALVIMGAAGAVTAALHLEGFSVTAILINYVMQLLPLAIVIVFSIFYVRHLTKLLTELGELAPTDSADTDSGTAAGAGDVKGVKSSADSTVSSDRSSKEGDMQVAIPDAGQHPWQLEQEKQREQEKQMEV